MKIFRALQISLKELRSPNRLTRIVSTQSPDAALEISPCEYKVKNKVKSKDKIKPSKLNRLFGTLRKIGETGHWKATTINTNILSENVSGSSNNNFKSPSRPIRSCLRDVNNENRCDEVMYALVANEAHMPVTIDNLLETARKFTVDEGFKASCDEHQFTYETIEVGVHSMQPNPLQMINPKIQKVIQEMLRLVFLKTKQHEAVGTIEKHNITPINTSLLERRQSNHDYIVENLTRILHSLLYTRDKMARFSILLHTEADSKCRNLLSMRSILMYDPLGRTRISNRSCYFQSNEYHTLSGQEKNNIEHLSVLPKVVNFHSSCKMKNADKNVENEWLSHFKGIANSKEYASKGSGALISSQDGAKVQTVTIIDLNSSNRDVSRLAHTTAISNIDSPQASTQATYDALGNSTLHEKSLQEKSSANSENEARNINDMSFRSTLSPEYVKPRTTSYEFQHDEEDTPHIAMLYSFCTPLSAGEYRESIVPIRVVDSRTQECLETDAKTPNLVNNHQYEAQAQGMLKRMLDKLNLLKWNK